MCCISQQIRVKGDQLVEKENSVFRGFLRRRHSGIYSHVASVLMGDPGVPEDSMLRLSRVVAVLVANKYMPFKVVETPLYADLLINPFSIVSC